MIGDKLVIEQYHTDRANEIISILVGIIKNRVCISVAGESGAGKSELAYEITRMLTEQGIMAEMIQQDDYFLVPEIDNLNHILNRLLRTPNQPLHHFYDTACNLLQHYGCPYFHRYS